MRAPVLANKEARGRCVRAHLDRGMHLFLILQGPRLFRASQALGAFESDWTGNATRAHQETRLNPCRREAPRSKCNSCGYGSSDVEVTIGRGRSCATCVRTVHHFARYPHQPPSIYGSSSSLSSLVAQKQNLLKAKCGDEPNISPQHHALARAIVACPWCGTTMCESD